MTSEHSDHTYIINEIVGSSRESVDAAIHNGLQRAGKTLRHLDRLAPGEDGHRHACRGPGRVRGRPAALAATVAADRHSWVEFRGLTRRAQYTRLGSE